MIKGITEFQLQRVGPPWLQIIECCRARCHCFNFKLISIYRVFFKGFGNYREIQIIWNQLYFNNVRPSTILIWFNNQLSTLRIWFITYSCTASMGLNVPFCIKPSNFRQCFSDKTPNRSVIIHLCGNVYIVEYKKFLCREKHFWSVQESMFPLEITVRCFYHLFCQLLFLLHINDVLNIITNPIGTIILSFFSVRPLYTNSNSRRHEPIQCIIYK